MGTQGSLLGIRATVEGFSNLQTGCVMSAYFLGFMLGSSKTVLIINKVGHVRTFAALAAVLSITILLHSLVVDYISWSLFRFFSGFAVSGIWLVSESWLNQSATNTNRGSLLSIYMMIISIGMASGQMVLTVNDPLSFVPYLIISLVVSIAGIPILMSGIQAPPMEQHDSVSIIQLFRVTPTGTVGIFIAGMSNAIVLGMGAVYGTRLGMDVAQVSYFIAAFLLGSIFLQWPLGKISDTVDRRNVTGLAGLAAAGYALISVFLPLSQYPLLVICAFFYGGLSLTLYSLFNALANDFLKPSQIVSASGGLLIISGLGATVGPIFVSIFMDALGPIGFYWALFILCITMSVFCFYRIIFHRQRPLHSTIFTVNAMSPVGGVLHEPGSKEVLQEG